MTTTAIRENYITTSILLMISKSSLYMTCLKTNWHRQLIGQKTKNLLLNLMNVLEDGERGLIRATRGKKPRLR